MQIHPIDIDWAQIAFPTTFDLLGRQIVEQIECFNRVVGGGVSAGDRLQIYFKMAVTGVDPHTDILNMLSAMQNPDAQVYGVGAPLCLVEQHLQKLARAGVPPTEYSSMIRSPRTVYQLLAELDWSCQLDAAGGKLHPHTPTGGESRRNFDVYCDFNGWKLLGDVKWYLSWLLKERGCNLLPAALLLARPDLKHRVTIVMRARYLGEDMVLDAVVEVLRLYEAAFHDDPTPFMKDKGEAGICIAPPPGMLSYIETLWIHESEPGHDQIRVIEGELSESEDDSAIKNNLLKAESQIPDSIGPKDLALIVIGSAIPEGAEDVENVVAGKYRVDRTTGGPRRFGGFWGAGSEATDLDKIHAVLGYSLFFDYDTQPVRALRTCRIIEQPNKVSSEHRDVLRRVVTAYCQPTDVEVAHR